ncbi:tryptophan synthase subunit alpha [Salinarchaeum sp. IM2453]|uniref:tryptophan synthase subunit alpha n=1 Tax=Salinarchaeum sp. IM2453 TaxID=2862870 RepID=UPI001C835365|nr:tryptophan synthase subunit alpha [Salinarchaeum sp. IM2453]QZA88850.1 tryptophan synthase subunit alpha [Salinarchaeum sp. IM2453]
MSDIANAFDDGPAFVPYLAAGDPDYESSLAYVEAVVEGGADVVELGLPFSDPVADGSTIREATVRSLSSGMTPNRFFEFVADLDVDVPLVCMTYYNLIYQYGDEKGPGAFVERAADAGIDGLVVPDLPAEEADPLHDVCDEFGLDLIFIVAPTTKGHRLDRIRELGSGYVYVQARLGTTGARDELSSQTEESLDRIADWDLPKAVGFGIKTGDHAEQIINAGADGIIVGSALVDIIAEGTEQNRPVQETADKLRSLSQELTTGAQRGQISSAPEPEGK